MEIYETKKLKINISNSSLYYNGKFLFTFICTPLILEDMSFKIALVNKKQLWKTAEEVKRTLCLPLRVQTVTYSL